MGTKEDVCEKLDKVLVEFFETLSQIYIEQDKLDLTLKSGFLNMSRARYSMGIKNVGIEQCDSNKMTATVKVSISDQKQFDLDNSVGQGHDLENDFNDLDLGVSSETNVRRRNVGKVLGDIETINRTEDIALDSLKKKKSGTDCDPIKWFGVLVPPALRQSQSDFKGSVETIMSIASLKAKISELQKQYTQLLTEKANFTES